MTSDNRARKVAADIRPLLAERGIVLTNKQARNAAARIFGHADWPAMLKTIGTGHSPDDSELDAIMLADRREQQIAVLVGIGVDDGDAPAVLERLAPTGRTAADVAQIEVVRFKHPLGLYHPFRMISAEHDNSPFDEEEELQLVPFDALLERSSVGSEISTMAFMVLDRGVFVDASMMPSVPPSSHDEADEYRRLMRLIEDRVCYVHVGTNRYPSPWLGCGIEGCYVAAAGDGQRLFLVPVVSPDNASSEVLQGYGFSPTISLIQCARGESFSLQYDDVDRRWLMRVGGTPALPWDDDALEQVVRDAVSATLADLENRLGVVNGIAVESNDAVVPRLQRARTAEETRRVVSAVAADDCEVVRFVGGVPAYALSEDLPAPAGIDRAEFGRLRVDDRMDHLEAWLSAARISYPETAVAMADRVIAFAPARDSRDVETAEIVVEAHAVKAKAIHEILHVTRGEADMTPCFEVAHAGFDETVPLSSEELIPYLAASTNGDPERVSKALSLLQALQDGGGIDQDDELMMWSVALILALSGEDASEWIEAASRRNDSIRARLLGETSSAAGNYSREDWFGGEHVVEVLGEAWKDVKDRERLLSRSAAPTV